MKVLLFICMMAGAIACSGQNELKVVRNGEFITIWPWDESVPNNGSDIVVVHSGCDTSAVLLIYLDKTRLFAAAPEYKYGLEVVEGWLIQCFDGDRFRNEYYDRSGTKYPEDIIVTWKKRTPE